MSLLFEVLHTPGILSLCTAFQSGESFANYEDGDTAASLGHLSLLKLRQELSQIHDSRHGEEASTFDGEGLAGDRGRGEAMEGFIFSQNAVNWAAAQGHLEVVRWLLQHRGEGCTETAVDDACWNGHEGVVRCLMCEFDKTGSHRAFDYAASTGRLELLKWLHERGMACTAQAMDGAAGGGHLETVRWLAANRKEGCSSAAFEMAATKGHLYVIQWMDAVGLLECSSTGLDNAAAGGHLHVLQWMALHKPEYQCTTNAYGLAASQGHLQTLKWLRETAPSLGCPAWAAEAAAVAGHPPVVEWLHEAGLCKASLVLLDDVAKRGELDAVIWLDEHGARASEAAVDLAAEAGHLSVVAYLLENRTEGCSPGAIVGAARRGHLDVVEYLYVNRPDSCGDLLACRAVAEAGGHGEVVRWLDERVPGLLQALENAVAALDISCHGRGVRASRGEHRIPEAHDRDGDSSSGQEEDASASDTSDDEDDPGARERAVGVGYMVQSVVGEGDAGGDSGPRGGGLGSWARASSEERLSRLVAFLSRAFVKLR